MRLTKIFAFGAIAVALSACTSFNTKVRDRVNVSAPAASQVVRDYHLHVVNFVVPADLTVSEANSYYPLSDIVWRGDLPGDRAAQITEIFETSIEAAGEDLTGPVPITVDVELVRFHSLTERARYSVGGVNSIKFDLTVRNTRTGEVLEERRRINGDFAALGGNSALTADRAGQTQKVRVIAHLSNLFLRELTNGATQQ